MISFSPLQLRRLTRRAGPPRTEATRPARSAGRLLAGPADRDALKAWAGTRAAVLLLGFGVAAGLSSSAAIPGFGQQWAHWDAVLLARIARFGYRGNPAQPQDKGLPAFFPGEPLLLRLVHAVVPDWTVAGVVLSFLAGAVAVVALARLAGRGQDFQQNGAGGAATADAAAQAGGVAARAGRYAVWGLLLAPPAVFLFAGYTEPVFLAFAIPAWLLALRRQWSGAALAAAGASVVRINGLFLAVALVVEFLVARRGQAVPKRSEALPDTDGAPAAAAPETRWRSAGWLVLPFVPVVLYAVYQWGRTGDILAWQHAQQDGWQRHLVSPVSSFITTWNAAFHTSDVFTWAFRAELAGAAAGVALALWLAWRRRWGELTYVGLAVVALLSSTYYLSVPREALLWWPLWTGLGRTAARRPLVFVVYAMLAAPLMAAYVVTFTRGAWAG